MLFLPQYLSWVGSLRLGSYSEARLLANANTVFHAIVALAVLPFVYRFNPAAERSKTRR